MEKIVGYTLRDSLRFLQERYHKIIKIVELVGTNSKFNKLDNPYIVKVSNNDEYITLFVTYY